MKPPAGEWADRAACKAPEHDPEMFFPDRGETVIPAKTVCATCTVRAECLAYAMTAPPERRGIWGGLSGRERRRLGTFALGDYLPAVKLTDDPQPGRPPKAKAEITHGTVAGYAAHWREGETVCHDRAEAKKAYARERRRNRRIGRPPAPINHGSVTGYRAHRRRGEDACDECLTAKRLHRQDERAEHRILEVVR